MASKSTDAALAASIAASGWETAYLTDHFDGFLADLTGPLAEVAKTQQAEYDLRVIAETAMAATRIVKASLAFSPPDCPALSS